MADPKNKPASSGLTRGKAILIAALGVALVGVLYVQFGGTTAMVAAPDGYIPRRVPSIETTAANQSEPVSAAHLEPNGTKAAKDAVRLASVVDAARWKSPPLEEVVDFDPFGLPARFPQQETVDLADSGEDLAAATAEESARKLAEALQQVESDLRALQQVGVQVIVRQGDQYVAMIGDRTVHVGEEIKGFTITKIDPTDGVIVERKASE